MADSKVPYVPPGLVTHLEEKFRDRSPRPDASGREIWMDVGSVRVVRYLKRLAEEQTSSS